MKNVSDVADIALANPRSCYPLNKWDKTFILEMFEKFGKEETIKRWQFQLTESYENTEKLINSYLNEDWVDEKGISGGKNFYGEL